MDSGCWEWQRGRDEHGYGRTRVDGKSMGAHRYIYEKFKGPIPDGLILDHLCRNPACVNPDHLEPVTYAENARRGNSTKLTQEQADEIRSLAAEMTNAELGKRYGVHPATIWCIVTRDTWR